MDDMKKKHKEIEESNKEVTYIGYFILGMLLTILILAIVL